VLVLVNGNDKNFLMLAVEVWKIGSLSRDNTDLNKKRSLCESDLEWSGV